jgi:hypothetical protein
MAMVLVLVMVLVACAEERFIKWLNMVAAMEVGGLGAHRELEEPQIAEHGRSYGGGWAGGAPRTGKTTCTS